MACFSFCHFSSFSISSQRTVSIDLISYSTSCRLEEEDPTPTQEVLLPTWWLPPYRCRGLQQTQESSPAEDFVIFLYSGHLNKPPEFHLTASKAKQEVQDLLLNSIAVRLLSGDAKVFPDQTGDVINRASPAAGLLPS